MAAQCEIKELTHEPNEVFEKKSKWMDILFDWFFFTELWYYEL